jgi:hypothetical protein
LCGNFYYFMAMLNGCSRYIIHWDIRESRREQDVELVLREGPKSYFQTPSRGQSLTGRHEAIFQARITKLDAARARRKAVRERELMAA